jgi:hypothetical protein
MPQDINQETIEHLIGRIQASNYMYFTKDEIKYDDIRYSKPLYIIVRCKNILICKILIDNGSILSNRLGTRCKPRSQKIQFFFC